MDFIPTTFSSFWSTFHAAGIAGFFALLAIAIVGMVLSENKNRTRSRAGLAVAIAAIVGMFSMLGTSMVTRAQEDVRSEEARAEVVETLNSTYGTDITVDELGYFSGLEYPRDRPESDFEVFGSVERDVEKPGDGFERQTIYLIWQDEKLQLAQSADGETFTVLGSDE